MSKELLAVATQAIEYLKEAGIKKPHFIKHAEEVIKNAKKANKPLSKNAEITKHFDAYLSGGQDLSYTKILAAMKRALKENPDGRADFVEVMYKGKMETVDLIEDLEGTTVKRFCEMCGIE